MPFPNYSTVTTNDPGITQLQTRAPNWTRPTNLSGSFPSGPPTAPVGKLGYDDWYNQIGRNMAYSTSFGSPAASYLQYLGGSGTQSTSQNPPTTSPTQAPTSVQNPQSPTPTQQPFDVSNLLNFLPSYLNQQMNNPFQASSYGQVGAQQQQNMYGLPSQGWGWNT